MSVLHFIEGYMDGNAWEELCVKCYRMRYQDDHYTEIPAVHGGDAGIEGFTNKGIVHQCYCPEREYDDDELYNHQRDKLTEDIGKLLANGLRLQKLGVPPIREWHFNIPEYKDSRIISHAATKQQEVLDAKTKDPTAFTHIADDFRIYIKRADDFLLEISKLIRTNLTDMKLNLTVLHSATPDWSKCDSAKVENIQRKIKAVMQVDGGDSLNEVVTAFVESYISGLDILNGLRLSAPDFYKDLVELESVCKREISIKTLMNTNPDMNSSLFWGIMADFEQKLNKEFSGAMTQTSIGEIKQDLVASWLADCSMEFKR